MQEIGIGLLGFGTVGTGMVRGLQKNGDLIARRTGIRLDLRAIADQDVTSDRGVHVDPGLLTTDAEAMIHDPRVEVVVELIGGTTAARTFILQALQLGKPVVTANKALLAEYGEEIFRVAAENNTDLYYEASVGGGIPIIRALREGLVANHVDSIYGILNGTCNYILTRMENEGLAFDDVLQQAQELGFAEAEPSLDIDGWDTAHKTTILASLAYGIPVSLDQVDVAGIRGLDAVDIGYAREMGYRIKLMAVIKHAGGDVMAQVKPTMVPLDHPLASVSGVFNAVMVHGDVVGDTMYYGAGAGPDATGSAVLGDLVDVARNLASDSKRRIPAFVEHEHYGSVVSSADMPAKYYVRLSLRNRPGTMAQVATAIGERDVGIASMLQKGGPADAHVPVVFVMEAEREADLLTALRELDALDAVGEGTVSYRIEEFAAG